MDWSNEDYVRVYTRDTLDDVELSWQAMALWHAILRKFDRSGLMEARNGWSSVAKAVRIPEDVVMAAGRELERDGRVIRTKRGLFAPNFMEAQTARKSDKARQAESRERRRAAASVDRLIDTESQTTPQLHDLTEPCHTVSPGSHTQSRDVTLCSADPLLCDPVALRCVDQTANESPGPTPGTASKVTRRRRRRIPDDWSPAAEAVVYAGRHDLAIAVSATKFARHYRSTGAVRADWDEAFMGWLESDAERKSNGPARAPAQTVLEILKAQIAAAPEEHDQH